jgi:hypothetical protein
MQTGAKKTIQQRFPKWNDTTSAWVAMLIATALALATWAGTFVCFWGGLDELVNGWMGRGVSICMC